MHSYKYVGIIFSTFCYPNLAFSFVILKTVSDSQSLTCTIRCLVLMSYMYLSSGELKSQMSSVLISSNSHTLSPLRTYLRCISYTNIVKIISNLVPFVFSLEIIRPRAKLTTSPSILLYFDDLGSGEGSPCRTWS